jgi:hypothetical protein
MVLELIMQGVPIAHKIVRFFLDYTKYFDIRFR